MSTTDSAGVNYGVSLRELARDLGLPNVWRKWTLEGWIAEVTAMTGQPGLRPNVALDADWKLNFPTHLEELAQVRPPARVWTLVECRRSKGRWECVWPRALFPVLAAGQQFPATMVLLHHLLDHAEIDSPATAALSTRLLMTGLVQVWTL